MIKYFTLRGPVHYPPIYSVIVSLLLSLVVAGCGSATSTTSSNGTGTATSGGTPITPGRATPTRVRRRRRGLCEPAREQFGGVAPHTRGASHCHKAFAPTHVELFCAWQDYDYRNVDQR